MFLSFYTPFFLSLGSFRVKTRITTVFNTVFTTVADLDFWERILFRHFKPSGTKNKSFQIYNTYRDHLFVLCTFFKLFYSFRSVNARPYPDLPGSLSDGILICPDPYLKGFWSARILIWRNSDLTGFCFPDPGIWPDTDLTGFHDLSGSWSVVSWSAPVGPKNILIYPDIGFY